jgi:hypothetical protein
MVRLPVKWAGKSILVADQSLINPPYTVDSVVSVSAALNGTSEDNAKSAYLVRVKHVVPSPPPSCYALLWMISYGLVATGTNEIGNWCCVKESRSGC